MPTVKEIVNVIEKAAPTSLRCEWDNDGLQVCPDIDAQVKKCLICLDVSDAAIDRAEKIGADMIVTHHPLLFEAYHSLTAKTPEPLMANRMYGLGISQLSAHTRLDFAKGGVCDELALRLGLSDVTPFGYDMLGRVGNISAVTGEEFIAFVKEKLGVPYVRCVCEDKNISRVAVVGGSGKEYLDAAILAESDAFVTGDVSYNVFLSAQRKGILLADAGHFFTEYPVCAVLERIIKSAYPNVETEIYFDYPIKEK